MGDQAAEQPGAVRDCDQSPPFGDRYTLPFELQSKLFEQVATLGVAGAGLVITLRGNLLANASPMIWLGAIEFGMAAVLGLAAQMNLIEGLFAGSVKRKTLQRMTIVVVILLGMGIGTLGTSVFIEGKSGESTENVEMLSKEERANHR